MTLAKRGPLRKGLFSRMTEGRRAQRKPAVHSTPVSRRPRPGPEGVLTAFSPRAATRWAIDSFVKLPTRTMRPS
jgi:hypothetical protein